MNLNDIPEGTRVECEINMGDKNFGLHDWKYARGHIVHRSSDTLLVFDQDFNPTHGMFHWYLAHGGGSPRRDHRNLEVLDKVKKDETLVPYSYTS